jgi:hypothetical protein
VTPDMPEQLGESERRPGIGGGGVGGASVRSSQKPSPPVGLRREATRSIAESRMRRMSSW